MFVDSHAHLDGKQFDSDRERGDCAGARGRQSKLMVAIGNGDGPDQVDCGIRLAEKYDFIYATLGIHPHEARLADEAAYQNMERLARHPKVIAWGEIGLDYYYDHSPREMQREVFTRQMELAANGKAADRDSLPSVGSERRLGRLHSRCCASIGRREDWEEFCTASRETGRRQRLRSTWDS
jgi:Tat protein secretion system quality control protein TatD with DNase activity